MKPIDPQDILPLKGYRVAPLSVAGRRAVVLLQLGFATNEGKSEDAVALHLTPLQAQQLVEALLDTTEKVMQPDLA